ncbi:MAG: hypothetical protein ACRC9L_02720, partial [Brevinema sp.]
MKVFIILSLLLTTCAKKETSVESIPADSIGGSNIEEPLQGICLKQNDPNPDDFVSEEDMI